MKPPSDRDCVGIRRGRRCEHRQAGVQPQFILKVPDIPIPDVPCNIECLIDGGGRECIDRCERNKLPSKPWSGGDLLIRPAPPFPGPIFD